MNDILQTGALESAITKESIKQLMDGFDPATLLPDISRLFGSLATVCRVCVMIGPIVLLALGLAYLHLRLAVYPAFCRRNPGPDGSDSEHCHVHHQRPVCRHGCDRYGLEGPELPCVAGGDYLPGPRPHPPHRRLAL